MKEISKIRKDYSKSTLDIDSVDADPIAQFTKWFNEALEAQVLEPNAMTLSTISKRGSPSSRVVLLKDIEKKQFVFYTNYQSQKGKELELNPACALNFFWPELERQVRIEGFAARVAAEAADLYFQSRPKASQVGAWASPQSALIKDRSILEERFKKIEAQYENQQVLPRPKQWGGYGVSPVEMEFWQGRPSRMHDRLVYTRIDDTWQINRLAP